MLNYAVTFFIIAIIAGLLDLQELPVRNGDR